MEAYKTVTEISANLYYIPSLAKEYKLLPYTRAIARTYNETLLKNVVIRSGGESETPAINADKAQEELVRLLFGLSVQEMDIIEQADYRELSLIIDEKTKEKKSELPVQLETSVPTLEETETP